MAAVEGEARRFIAIDGFGDRTVGIEVNWSCRQQCSFSSLATWFSSLGIRSFLHHRQRLLSTAENAVSNNHSQLGERQ